MLDMVSFDITYLAEKQAGDYMNEYKAATPELRKNAGKQYTTTEQFNTYIYLCQRARELDIKIKRTEIQIAKIKQLIAAIEKEIMTQ